MTDLEELDCTRLRWLPEDEKFYYDDMRDMYDDYYMDMRDMVMYDDYDYEWTAKNDYALAAEVLHEKPPHSSKPQDSILLTLLSRWLGHCDRDHPCWSGSEKWPTRVIDVGDPTSTSIKLLKTKSIRSQIRAKLSRATPKILKGETSEIKYLALSHCWGNPSRDKKTRWCTTSDNYNDRLSGFSVSDLPRTFQDAIYVTRALGLKYLWIDAICIIQEDSVDWEKESKMMEQVFSSAYCTIAADAAQGWENGFLQRESPPQFTEQNKDRKRVYSCNTEADFKDHVINSRLNKRAWVLQERILSPRILHFTKDHTYFACGENVRCENFTILKSGLRKEFFILDPAFPTRLTRSGYKRTIEFVQTMFEQYARAGLSERADKSIAISGLMQRMSSAFSSPYIYGTFDCFLSRLLLWRVSDTAAMNVESSDVMSQLPSWSWLSHDYIEFFPKDTIEIPANTVWFEDKFDNKLDDIAEDKRQLCAYVFELRDGSIKREGQSSVLINNYSEKIGEAWSDCGKEIPVRRCVIVGRKSENKDIWLILLVSESEQAQFRRVGVAQVNSSSVSELSIGKGVLI